MTWWWTVLYVLTILSAVVNCAIIVADIRKRRRKARDRTPGSQPTIADLTERNLWQADQIEKLSRQLWDKESERLMLHERLKQLGVDR